jgi:hypothetical protein
MRLETKRGDTEPNEAILYDGAGKRVNLGVPPTQAVVRFLAKPVVAGVGQTVNRPCDVLQTDPDTDRGHVRIPWQDADVAVAGTHRAEFEVVFDDGTRKTFPNDGYASWVVWSDLG